MSLSLLIVTSLQEFKRIQDFKRNVCNEKSAKLEPWDEDYFIGMMKSAVHNLDVSVCANFCGDALQNIVELLYKL